MSVPAGVMLNGLQGASPEDIQQILGMSETPQKEQSLQQQMAVANSLRNNPAPEGRGFGYGKMYTAPSPLEEIGHVMLQYQGMKQAKNLQDQSADLAKQNSLARQKFFNILQAQYAAKGANPDAGGGVGGSDAAAGAGPL